QNAQGSSEEENRNNVESERAGTGVPARADENLAGDPQHTVSELRRQIIARDERIARLNNELSQREAELRQLRIEATKDIAERFRAAASIAGTGIKPRFSILEFRHFLISLRSAMAACYVGASRFVSSLRRWKFAR